METRYHMVPPWTKPLVTSKKSTNLHTELVIRSALPWDQVLDSDKEKRPALLGTFRKAADSDPGAASESGQHQQLNKRIK